MERSASIAVLVLLACLATCSFAQAPPVFTNPSQRQGYIEENVGGDALVRSLVSSDAGPIDLSVTDPDGGGFNYSITPAGGKFGVNGDSKLVVMSSLDRENTDEQTITLMVQLMYSGQVSTSSITIVVTVLDVNDNAPVYTPGTVTPINEYALLVGFTITLLDVTDLDQGTNGQLTYEVVTPADLVGVNPFGRVFLRAPVGSVDQDTNIAITVCVSDGGDPAMQISIDLTLMVLNSLELPPQFSLNEYIANIDEATYSTPVDIVTVMATRHSFGASGTNPIRYESIDTPTGFAINRESGRVTFRGTLDRETQPIIYLTVTAVEVNTDDETVQTSLVGYARVQVALGDINDNNPIFFNYVGLSGTQDNPYRAVVSEAVALGHIVVSDAEAFDPDEGSNSEFTYSIMATGMELPFAIDSNTGIITTDTLLDYEGTVTYTFTILATETVDGNHVGSATVIVDITNVNDNSPVFPASFYLIEVNEGPPSQDPLTATATVNTDMITTTAIAAIDNDRDDFGEVTYALISADGTNFFSVSQTIGEIFVTAALDREMRDAYHLTLVATDDGGLSATTLIVITVLDVNDNTPTFRPAVFTLVLIESTDYPSALTVFATDGDQPGTVNSMLSYSISPTTNFGIQSSTGVINAFELDCETAMTHTLIVTATDAGTSPLTGSATINVRLQCLNELGPVFNGGAPYSATISEALAVGQPIGATAMATDPEGHSVLYAISPALPDGAFFNIDETSGVISLALAVDRDPPSSQEQLMIEIYARDNAELPRTASTTVTISVDNFNDNPPIITNPPARDPIVLSILEADGPGVFPYALFTVDASDLDTAAGDSITFSLTGSTHFSIGQDGIVSHATSLDRETSATEQFTILACDSGAMCDTVDMTINVLDYNDNAPAFTGEPYTSTVTECDARARTSVVTVTAVDNMDIGPNQDIEYQLVSGSGFTVDRSTGVVYTEGNSFDFESGMTSFSVTIRATDNPSGSPQLQDETTLTVTLTDCNDNAPMFSSDGRYTVTVADDSMPAANPIYTGILVNDLDTTGTFQTVTYAIDGGPSQTNNWIDIDPSTGHLNIRPGQTVNREDSALQIDSNGNGIIVFSIIATNTAPGPFSTELSDSAVITVVVEDVNDNDPIFQNTNPLQVFIVENAVNSSIVAVVAATDVDTGTNAHIRYTITSGNDGTFQLDAESGHLTVAIQANLDRETNTGYTLMVQAENDLATGGTPATLTIAISVTGTNDHSPIFGETQYVATLAERNEITMVTVTVGAPVDTVLATDQDEPNTAAGMIEYRILTGNMLNEVTVFDIPDPIQGAVIVLRPDLLNYEERTQWDLVIEAYDLVSPITERRQDSTHLIINIMDLNDNIPMFTQPSYSATIVETDLPNTVAMLFPSIRATDLDAGGNDPLEYSLDSGIPFTISADGTSLTATQPIDRETIPSFNSTIRVQDGSGNVARANLIVEVIDINDNAPRFLLTVEELAINIPENLNIFPHPDSLIRTVEAVDDDEGNNARITYRLSGGRGNFDITQSTGVVRLIAPLDRDTIASRYILNVTATDGLHTSWRAFTANIENINDNNPEFLQAVWEGTLAEDAPIGSTLLSVDMSTQIPTFLRLMAEDLDPDSNVTYKLSPTDVPPNLPFRVTLDGYIVTTAALDREQQQRHSFAVQATDGFRIALTEAIVEVVIGDVNDESPQFQQPSYEVDVYELTPGGAIFLILQANDADAGTNSEITYRIATDQGGNTIQFIIDMTTGALSPTEDVNIGGSIDTTIVLMVEASDMGTPSVMSTTVNLQLTLVDRNLEAPAFLFILYTFSAAENIDNVPVGTVVAMDSTGDQDAVITYSIVSGHNLFVINASTGLIRSVAPLDREGRDLYTFTISAVDSAAQPRTGFTTVMVRVEDINDNQPFFDPESYPVFVSENSQVGTTVVRVMAFDIDAGTNAELTYSIFTQSPGDIPVFEINQMGEITTLVDIDREVVGVYNLVVQVTDSSVNPQTTQTDVMITINDVNDNTPRFVSGAVLSGTPVEIPEDAEPGTLVTTLQAEDPDFQLNGIVGYYFDNLARTLGPFQIDRDTGEITLRPGMDGELDREIDNLYELRVIAADLRGLGNTSRSVSGVVRVQVLDINDNLPTFLDPLYEFAILESYPLNTPYGVVVGTDLDVGINAELNYFFIGDDNRDNSSCSNQFCVDRLTGELILVKTLDHEASESHLLTLAVTNSPILEYNETTGMPIAATTGTLSVTVIDANDNGPVFVQSTLFAAVAEEAQFGTTITTVEAIDSDSLNGSIVWFEVVTPQVPYLVDRDTGVVTTAGVFSGLSGTRQEVTMRAYDNFGQVPTFSSMGIMIVQVYKQTELVIITFSRDKEVVEAKIGRIMAALEEVTSARITITEVRVEVTDAGEVDISGTDVLFFTLDPDSGNVINPSIIVRRIDQNYPILDNALSDCKVERIRAFNSMAATAASLVPVWLWVVLAILAAGVLCMCCCFLIGCVVERRRSRRWKKKATQSVDQYATVDYSAFNNPLWVSPYDGMDTSSTVSTGSTAENSNPLYESQELTIEMFQDDGEDEEEKKEKVTKKSHKPVKAPPLTIPAPVVKRSDGLYDSQEIEIEMYDELDDPESDRDSNVDLIRSSTPSSGLAGKRGGKGRAHYSRDDELLDAAVGGRHGRSYF